MQVKQYIPNILTLCNLITGGLSIIYIFQEQISVVLFLLGLSLILDFLDGLTARLLRATSEIGKQLDSLADMVSFGLAPGFIMMLLINVSTESVFPSTDVISWGLIAMLIPACSAIRLAKFNLEPKQSSSFYGLPTPANTLLILSYWSMIHFQPNTWLSTIINHPLILIILTLISSLLLISNIQLISLKFTNLSLKDNLLKYLLLVVGGLSFVFLEFSSIPLIIILYILFSVWSNYMQGV